MESKSGPGAALPPKKGQQGVGCPKGWLKRPYWGIPKSLREWKVCVWFIPCLWSTSGVHSQQLNSDVYHWWVLDTSGCLPASLNSLPVFGEVPCFRILCLLKVEARLPLAQQLLLIRYRQEMVLTSLTPTWDFDWEANAMKKLMARGTHSAEPSGRLTSSQWWRFQIASEPLTWVRDRGICSRDVFYWWEKPVAILCCWAFRFVPLDCSDSVSWSDMLEQIPFLLKLARMSFWCLLLEAKAYS